MSTEDKKTDLIKAEETQVSSTEEEYTFNYTKEEEAKLIRKVDYNLLIILGLLYSFALIDRSNLSNAAVSGMNEDLELTGTNRYSIISLIFFIPYILVELPCNVLIRRVSPRWVLGGIGVAWGAVMVGMGFVTSWYQLVICRILLGAFEGGFFPGCTYLIQCWYKRREVQKRMAFFYVISVCAAGFSNILAWGLTTIGPAHGIEGWRWIFIVEGAITIGIGGLCLIFIQDFPDKKSRFLTDYETAFIRHRVQQDRGDADASKDSMSFGHLMSHLLDYKLWIYALMFMSAAVGAYANGYFLPLILRGMGFNVRDSQILSAPPYVFAVIVCLSNSYFSDKYFFRAPFIIFQAVLVVVGMAMTAYGNNNASRYAGAFLNIAGCQSNVPAILAYNANNICTHSKRAVSSALTISFGAIGGIYATTTYREQDAPDYVPGVWASIAINLMTIAFMLYLTFIFKRANNKQAKGTLKEPLEGIEGFRYTL